MNTNPQNSKNLPKWSADRKSPEQLASVFTARLLFFDGNKRTWHQWKQEVVQKVVPGEPYSAQVNHLNAFRTLKEKIIYGKDQRERRFYDFLKSALIYENIHNKLVMKFLGKNIQYEAKLNFLTTELNNVILSSVVHVDFSTGELKKDVFTSEEIGKHIGRNRKFREEKEKEQEKELQEEML